jgi:hypothetical protein
MYNRRQLRFVQISVSYVATIIKQECLWHAMCNKQLQPQTCSAGQLLKQVIMHVLAPTSSEQTPPALMARQTR